MSEQEKQYLEWFWCRTAKKIPGIFVLTFWDSLVMQASIGEPAVLHAVLVLSSVHKNGFVNDSRQNYSDQTSSKQEQFMLEQYSKAIGDIQLHLPSQDKLSVRVALITCIVFVCFEYLGGRFRTAQVHLQSGLRVLEEMQASSTVDPGGVPRSDHSSDPIDDWIAQAFSGRHVQAMLFRKSCQPCLQLQDSRLDLPLLLFRSLYRSLADIGIVPEGDISFRGTMSLATESRRPSSWVL